MMGLKDDIISIIKASELNCSVQFFKKILFIYILRGGGREKGEGEKHQCVVASHVAPWGPGPQPRHVP